MRCTSLLILAAGASQALGQLTPQWIERHDVNYKDVASSMAIDDDGSFYVAATTQPTNQLASQDALLARFASGGTLLWSKVYDGPAQTQDLGGVVLIAPDGDVLHVFRSGGVGTGSDIAILKHDAATGDVIWEQRWHDTSIDRPTWAVVDDAGFIYIAGATYGSEQNDYITIKLDPDGNELWSAPYAGPGQFLFAHDTPSRIALDPGGDVIVTGTSNDPGGHPDFTTIKYDGQTGQQLWLTRYTGAGANDVAGDLIVDDAGDAYVFGYSNQLGDKFATVKYEGQTGSQLWAAIDDPGIHDSPARFRLAPDGFLYQAGTSDPDGDESNNNDNIVVIKRDPASGAEIWETVYGDSTPFHLDTASNIVVDSALNVIVLGRTDSFGIEGTFALMIFESQTGQLAEHAVFDGAENEWASGYLLGLDPAEHVVASGVFYNFNTEARDILATRFDSLVGGGCKADFNGDGALSILDFVAFQNAFTGQDPGADCDGSGALNILDFVCFQGLFQAGCP
jgi:hypothetical protein